MQTLEWCQLSGGRLIPNYMYMYVHAHVVGIVSMEWHGMLLVQAMYILHCMVPENIHTPTMEGNNY